MTRVEKEILEQCGRHMDTIFVREEIDSKWCTVTLAELPWTTAMNHITSWVERSQFPYRVKPTPMSDGDIRVLEFDDDGA